MSLRGRAGTKKTDGKNLIGSRRNIQRRTIKKPSRAGRFGHRSGHARSDCALDCRGNQRRPEKPRRRLSPRAERLDLRTKRMIYFQPRIDAKRILTQRREGAEDAKIFWVNF